MYRVLYCLANEHDYGLVFLAVVVCVSTTLTCFWVYRIASHRPGAMRFGWSVVAGICAGTGTWATHFIAMLGYGGSLPTAYAPFPLLGSLFVSIVMATAGFCLATRRGQGALLMAGFIVSVGIGAMHYTGMAALVVPGVLHWDPTLVLASWLINLPLSCAAFIAFDRLSGLRAVIAGAALETAVIAALHFTGMSAMTIVPDPLIAFSGVALDRPWLAVATGMVVFLVLTSAIAAASVQLESLKYEKALRETNERFSAALQYLPVGLSMFGADRKLILCNAKYSEVLGLCPDDVKAGATFHDLLDKRLSTHKEGTSDQWIDTHDQQIASGNEFTQVHTLENGRTILVRVGPMVGGGWVDIQEDITDQHARDAKIAFLARHDALTGLPNRASMQERLDMVGKSRRGNKIAVLFLDLDRFKDVNDTFGHRTGDALLKVVADRLRGCVRSGDTVARVGGDEFIVVQAIDNTHNDPALLAERIISQLGQPYDVDGQVLSIDVSIGIAVWDGAIDTDTLVTRADLALYRSKSSGRGIYTFFDEEMDTRAQRRRQLEADLRIAVADGDLKLHYQPIFDVASGEVTAVEALLRWTHSEWGAVSPAEFIPIAEETRLVCELGDWVLRRACHDAQALPSHVKVAVNLSPAQFRDESLLDLVQLALCQSGLSPHRLELEITEGALLESSETTLSKLRALRDLGVSIALDDFGVGYSSLSYLRSFPFDKLKIDRCFVAGLTQDDNSLQILRAIVGLGRALDLAVTAEGLETEEQLAIAKAEGCPQAQGYLLARPAPLEAIGHLFERQEAAAA